MKKLKGPVEDPDEKLARPHEEAESPPKETAEGGPAPRTSMLPIERRGKRLVLIELPAAQETEIWERTGQGLGPGPGRVYLCLSSPTSGKGFDDLVVCA